MRKEIPRLNIISFKKKMEILFASILRVLHPSLATEFLPHFSYGLRLFSHVFTDSRKDMHYNNDRSWVFFCIVDGGKLESFIL